jgi:hypothetical protein
MLPSRITRRVGALTMRPEGEFRQSRKEYNMHSTAYAHQLKNGEWEVRLPIPGHLLSDKHLTLHKT